MLMFLLNAFQIIVLCNFISFLNSRQRKESLLMITSFVVLIILPFINPYLIDNALSSYLCTPYFEPYLYLFLISVFNNLYCSLTVSFSSCREFNLSFIIFFCCLVFLGMISFIDVTKALLNMFPF